MKKQNGAITAPFLSPKEFNHLKTNVNPLNVKLVAFAVNLTRYIYGNARDFTDILLFFKMWSIGTEEQLITRITSRAICPFFTIASSVFAVDGLSGHRE